MAHPLEAAAATLASGIVSEKPGGPVLWVQPRPEVPEAKRQFGVINSHGAAWTMQPIGGDWVCVTIGSAEFTLNLNEVKVEVLTEAEAA